MDIAEKIREVLRELIVPRCDFIRVIYLFGSFAKSRESVKSDIDLAFVFYERFYKEDPFVALQEAELLGNEISKKIQKAVDVVILNRASLVFAYYTVKTGLCVYESNTTDRILYEIALDNKYQDFVPFIKELREIKRKTLIGRD